MQLQELINTLSIWSIFLPIITGIYKLLKLKYIPGIIFSICLIGTPPQLLNYIHRSSPLKPLFYNLYLILEFVLVYFLFRRELKKRRLFTTMVCLFYPLIAFYFLQNQLTTEFTPYMVCVNSAVYIVWVFIFIMEQVDSEDSASTFSISNSFFWYLTGIFLYATCTYPIFMLWDYIYTNKNDPLVKSLLMVHDVINTLMYVLFTIGLIKDYQVKEAS